MLAAMAARSPVAVAAAWCYNHGILTLREPLAPVGTGGFQNTGVARGGQKAGQRGPGPGPGPAEPQGRPHLGHAEAWPGHRQSPPSSHTGLRRHRSGGLSVSSPEVMLPLIGPQVVRPLCCSARPPPQVMTSDWPAGLSLCPGLGPTLPSGAALSCWLPEGSLPGPPSVPALPWGHASSDWLSRCMSITCLAPASSNAIGCPGSTASPQTSGCTLPALSSAIRVCTLKMQLWAPRKGSGTEKTRLGPEERGFGP